MKPYCYKFQSFMQFYLERDNSRLVVEYIDIDKCGAWPPNECGCESMMEHVLRQQLQVDEIRATFKL